MVRSFDIILSIMGLVMLLPLLILASLLVVFDDGAPLFFSQIRLGRDFNNFKLLKFRTMFINAEKTGQITVGGKDSRITRSGYFLRKYKLDEIPQLFNVIKGDMSLVGPRPEVSRYVNSFKEEYKKLLSVRPGITSPASVHFSNENELLENIDNPTEYYERVILPKKIELDLEYVYHRSVQLYFKVIFATIKKVLLGNKD